MRALRTARNAQIHGAAFIVAALVAVLFVSSGIGSGAENALRDSRDTLRITPASGEIVIVEIDGRSLSEIDEWPWPRRHYATAIEELDRLGAEQIAFDIDFSSRSEIAEDARLAKAIDTIGQPVILPTFRQLSRAGTGQTISEAIPIPGLRENSFLASVNVFPGADGRITHYPNGTTTNGTARPSLANMLAKKGGEVDLFFRVDQAIAPNTIPRLSFIDLVEGKVAREDVAGKRVVIGATAIELGDRYSTALYGVQPGVVIQAQAAETLLQDRARSDLPAWFTLGLLMASIALALVVQRRSADRRLGPSALAIGTGAFFVVLALALDQLALPYIPLAGPLLFVVLFVGLHRAIGAAASLEAERMTDTASGIANGAAMARVLTHRPQMRVAVARVADFGDVATVLGSSRLAMLDGEIVRRLALLSGIEDVYRIDSGLFGWLVSENGEDNPDELFASARALFNAPFDVDGERFRLSLNFGFVAGSIEGATYASADARKRGLVWSSNAENIHEGAHFRQHLLSELDEALSNGAISVVYQPKLRFADGAIAGAECLVRWNSREFGHISPSEFIPILESKDRIDELTRFVLRQAIDDYRLAVEAGRELNIAVNISAQLLGDEAFVTYAMEAIGAVERSGDGGITLEITESAPLADSVRARSAIMRLRASGARISIDDYGTGQATLHYLQDFPVQELKLDQSFVRGLRQNRKDQIMVQSTIELAHALGFAVVAEGVEDRSTLDILRELGCDYAQGWQIGKPMSWAELAAFVNDHDATYAAA
ncbi:EAL domain-containing protein [Erythrobacter sp. GH1-10]|uniref:EAL domain-containing protein n=1 Tax=Erythrobacter sp. GH1-10 TaxID=3349334 RepID=UPI0038781805